LRERPFVWKYWLSFFLFIFAVPIIPFTAFGELPGETWIENPSSTYVFLVGTLLLGGDILLPIPSSLIAVFLGARLGVTAGAVATFIGLSLSGVIGYYTGWYLGYPLVSSYTSKKSRNIAEFLEARYGYVAPALLRSVPILAEAAILAAGAARIKPQPVLITLSVANAGLALLYAGLGDAGQSSSPVLLFFGGVGVPAAGIVLIYGITRFSLLFKSR
jgi:uncharacterized membrane protein YdjX (TVP38/TMEM64 family)